MYIDPKNDFAFQYVFGRQENKDILISFLNAVLKMPPDEKLTDITIMETKLDKELLHEKSARLDIRAVTAAREQINIEIQLANQYNMEKRTPSIGAGCIPGSYNPGMITANSGKPSPSTF